MTIPDPDASPGPDGPHELPMFPLGSVLLPGMVLPLRVFEPRYRVLVDTVLLADRQEFGSVVIERGSEVGGGDVRATTGCLARIVELARHDDGTVSLVAIGTRRLRVTEWLEDDPFPRAVVEHWDDDPSGGGPPATDAIDQIQASVRRVLALVSTLDPAAGDGDYELDDAAFSDDPALRVYQLATVSPLGAHDRLRLLTSADLGRRIGLLQEMLVEQEMLLEARRSFGQE